MDFWHLANGYVSLVCAVVLTAAILHPKLHEGLVIKTGLIAMAISLGATAWLTLGEVEDWQALWRAGFILRAGLLCTIVGCLLRLRAVQRHARSARKTFLGSFFHG